MRRGLRLGWRRQRGHGLYFGPAVRSRHDEDDRRGNSWIRYNGPAGCGLRQRFASPRSLRRVDGEPLDLRCDTGVRESAEQLLRGDQRWRRATGSYRNYGSHGSCGSYGSNRPRRPRTFRNRNRQSNFRFAGTGSGRRRLRGGYERDKRAGSHEQRGRWFRNAGDAGHGCHEWFRIGSGGWHPSGGADAEPRSVGKRRGAVERLHGHGTHPEHQHRWHFHLFRR